MAVEAQRKLEEQRRRAEVEKETRALADVQQRLEKYIGEAKEKANRNELFTPSAPSLDSFGEVLSINDHNQPISVANAATTSPTFDRKTKPTIDRTTKPTSLLSFHEKEEPLRSVVIPHGLVDKFLVVAKENTNRNIETCGILAGKLAQNAFTITHVLIPSQKGTADSCQTESEEGL